jgi:predicted dehydrogenase
MSKGTLRYDIFLSHATDDKPVAREIYSRLCKYFNVWFDEEKIMIGDSISQSINEGLSQSEFGVVILSRSFIEKERKWTKIELGTLFSMEKAGRKVIIPVIHALSADEIEQSFPLMADRRYANTNSGFEEVVASIVRSVNSSRSDQKSDQIPDQNKNIFYSSLSVSEAHLSLPIKVILAGCGRWARERTVFPLYKENPDLFEIVGISDLEHGEDELRSMSADFEAADIPIPSYYGTLSSAITRIKDKIGSNTPIAVVINTPNALHEQLAWAALNENCHVYAERPINRASDDLEGLLRRTRSLNRYLFNGLQRRLEPPYRYLFNVLRKKERFGNLKSIRCKLASGHYPSGWRLQKALAGGGIVIDEGYHLLDASMWLMEAAFPGINIQAEDFKNIRIDFSSQENGIETVAFGSVLLPNDVHLYFDLSQGLPFGSVFEEIEIRDDKRSLVKLTRDQHQRTKDPGRVIHHSIENNKEYYRSGFVVANGISDFSIQNESPRISANTTGPLKDFFAQITTGDSVNSGLQCPPLLLGVNECDARFVVNTQRLIHAIYKASSK